MQHLKWGRCDNVVRMLDYGWEQSGAAATIVMELMEYGSLLEYLRWSVELTLVSDSALGTGQPACIGMHKCCVEHIDNLSS